MIISLQHSIMRTQHPASQSPTDVSRLPPLPTREPLVSDCYFIFLSVLKIVIFKCLYCFRVYLVWKNHTKRNDQISHYAQCQYNIYYRRLRAAKVVCFTLKFISFEFAYEITWLFPFLATKFKKGMKTAKQRLGKILKIHKMMCWKEFIWCIITFHCQSDGTSEVSFHNDKRAKKTMRALNFRDPCIKIYRL